MTPESDHRDTQGQRSRGRKRGPLERIGRRVAAMPSSQIFGLGIFAFLVFLLISLLIVSNFFDSVAENVAARNPEEAPEQLDFRDKVVKATGAAYSTFFDLALSKVNFISNYVVDRDAGARRWEFTFWELWVPASFDVVAAEKKFAEKLAPLGDAVKVSGAEVDSKTFQINIDVEGLNTHRVFLTRVGMETDQTAEAMYVPPPLADAVPRKPFQGAPRVAIIIDDIGFREIHEHQLLALDAPLTFSILPYSPYGKSFAGRALSAGREIMLHMPMEPLDRSIRPGKGGLFVEMTPDVIRQMAVANLEDIPGAKGTNNHMGSRFTSDAEKMTDVLQIVKARGLYFVDSRTSGSSIAFDVARRMGIRSAVRNVFLDHNPEYPAILNQIDVLAGIAKRQGEAIAIGHPHENTLRALRAKLPELAAAGIRLVPPSELVH
ncbi:divergent polysaccharide deacetylase family protein [bacterium]|nr:divergent polysaccharide deacetylase family protein [bacterium]